MIEAHLQNIQPRTQAVLERFLSILDLYINSQTFGDKVALKCSPLPTPCKLSMSDHDIHVMQAFRGQLQRVGITFEDASSSGAQSSVRIKTVPSVFLAREVSDDGEVLRNEIKNCIEVYSCQAKAIFVNYVGSFLMTLPGDP